MTVEVSTREHEIVVGTILGDGHLVRLKQDARLEINHSDKQKDYVFWKHRELSRWTSARPHRITISDKRWSATYGQWRFKTKTDPVFTGLHSLF